MSDKNEKIYKYIGPKILNTAFTKKGFCSFKCSLPKDFNDPYELFLAIDFNQSTEMLAFYNSIIGEIPQRPTTCFSKSPIIIPMWAHYGHTSKGFVLEIDKIKIMSYFENTKISDVSYQNSVSDKIFSAIQLAHGTLKPRHTWFVQNMIMNAAYFTKNTCWDYEKECRLVTEEKNVDDNMLLHVPSDCITSIIVGEKTTLEDKKYAIELTDKISSNYYELKISKNSSAPYFSNRNKETFIFKDGKIIKTTKICTKCSEPIDNENEKECTWCKITEKDISEANMQNPMNILNNADLLEKYLKSMASVGKS